MAQTTESFLEKVKLNHPGILAAQHLLTSDEAESRTGITPADPFVSAGYFPGNDAAGENKITWGVSQAFDFPTRYARLKTLKKTNLKLAEMEYELTLLQLMSEARSAAIDLISIHRQIAAYKIRLSNVSGLEEAYSTMLNSGVTTMLEYNKIVIKRVELQSQLTSLLSSEDQLRARLDYMSANNTALLSNVDYPMFNEPDIDLLGAELKDSHPVYLLPELRKEVAGTEIDLSRSEGLPAFELGYSSEIVGTTRFTGPSLGMTLPLWKNKGKVRKAKAGSDYEVIKAEGEFLMLEAYYGSLYRNYVSTRENLILVEKTLDTSNNFELLKKALDAGEINLTEYLLELGSVYQLEDLQIELNRQLYSLLSKLFELDFRE